MENIFRLIDISKNKEIQQEISKRKIGFFPGKFNPPHMGHLLTILKLSKKYNIIVGLTEDVPENAFPRHVILEILKELEEFGIKIIEIKGILIEKKDISDLPFFDVLLSGNPDVLKWANNMNIKFEYIERSCEITASQLRNGS